jgi:hypothetical protein
MNEPTNAAQAYLISFRQVRDRNTTGRDIFPAARAMKVRLISRPYELFKAGMSPYGVKQTRQLRQTAAANKFPN